jgi:hypothetical protein
VIARFLLVAVKSRVLQPVPVPAFGFLFFAARSWSRTTGLAQFGCFEVLVLMLSKVLDDGNLSGLQRLLIKRAALRIFLRLDIRQLGGGFGLFRLFGHSRFHV